MIAMGLAVVPKKPEQELAAYRKRLEDAELRQLMGLEEEPRKEEQERSEKTDHETENDTEDVPGPGHGKAEKGKDTEDVPGPEPGSVKKTGD